LQNYAENDRATRYSVAPVSLVGKMTMELVYMTGSWCGSGGCTALLLEQERSSFELIEKFTIVKLPISVLPTVTHGWHDIAVHVGGGGVSYHAVVLRYNGSQYPSNPTLAPAITEALAARGKELHLSGLGEPLYP